MVTRRHLLKHGAAIALSGGNATWAESLSERSEQWMTGWMETPQQGRRVTRGEEGVLLLSRFADPVYFLRGEIRWKPDEPNADLPSPFNVPEGFVTDLASIPQVFWNVLRPDGDYAYAAILHDFLYWQQLTTKVQADHVLKDCMKDFGVSRAKIDAIYTAVDRFGGTAWDTNRALKAKGERRFLAKFPTDPRVRWKLWKTDPQHFRA